MTITISTARQNKRKPRNIEVKANF